MVVQPRRVVEREVVANAVDPAVVKGGEVQLVAADVGPLGAVAVVSVVRDAIADRGGVTVTQGGYTLRILNAKMAAVVTDAEGKEIARSDGIGRTTGPAESLRYASDGSVVLADPATGATIVRFSLNSVKDALNRSAGNDVPTFRLVASRDRRDVVGRRPSTRSPGRSRRRSAA